jgi:mRNA interferase HicA
VKRTKLIAHLTAHRCELDREGGRHSIWWNPETGEAQAVPRHTEIDNVIARKICRALSVPDPPG